MSDNVNKLASYCQETLDLAKAVTPDDYGYNNLILCIIDAIFSMGVHYSSTRKTVQRFIDYFDIQKIYPSAISSVYIKNTRLSLWRRLYIRTGNVPLLKVEF